MIDLENEVMMREVSLASHQEYAINPYHEIISGKYPPNRSLLVYGTHFRL